MQVMRSRRTVAHAAIALAVISPLVAACGGGDFDVPPRVAFDPKPGPPSCSGDKVAPPEVAAKWPDYQAKVAALGNVIGSPKPDAPIVVETLRTNVRKLVEPNGCHIERQPKGWDTYDIVCANLSPADEATRVKLVAAVRTHVPKILETASSFDHCSGSAPSYFQYEIDKAAQGGSSSGETLAAAHAGDLSKVKSTAGCASDNLDACDAACGKGDSEACRTWGFAKMRDDQRAAATHFGRACELALGEKKAEAIKGSCSIALMELVKADSKAAFELADKVCASAPADGACAMRVIDAKDPIYSKKRAEAVFAAADACTGDACDKSLLFFSHAPAYQKERANRAMPWLVAKCDAKDEMCAWVAYGIFNPKSPRLEPNQSKKILKVIEDGCQTSFAKVPQEVLCGTVVMAHAQGGIDPSPKKALETAEKLCDTAERHCTWLAYCYEEGTCGVPKDAAKALDAYAKDCEGRLSALDASIREQVRPSYPSCQKK